MDVILIVDDERFIREELAHILDSESRTMLFASDGMEALEVLSANKVDLLLTDIRMPRLDGFGLLERVRQNYPSIPVIMITAFASTDTAVKALRTGAYDYISKPFSNDEIRNRVTHALVAQKMFKEIDYLRGRLTERYSMENIIGQCPEMQKVFDTISTVAGASCNILITGESGTGKDLVAQAIHQQSSRSNGRFVPINCGSIPEGLLESELFGHVKGAFTGAVENKEGLVQTANGGTLFLDEIGDMPVNLQVKLLRLIQNHQVQKIGSTSIEQVDVRIIAATNQDLAEKISCGQFRQDLYYRINVVEISLPALRERGSDITLLVSRFIKKFSDLLGKDVQRLSPEVTEAFMTYSWPGNIRELENAIERGVTLCRTDTIQLADIPDSIANFYRGEGIAHGTLAERVESFEKQCIQKVIDDMGDVERAADELGVSLATLYRKIKKMGIQKIGPIVEMPEKKTRTRSGRSIRK